MDAMKLMVAGLVGWSCHIEGNHAGLENEITGLEFPPTSGAGEVRCRKRPGGLLRYYYRDAA